MNTSWVNGRASSRLDSGDRGLQYGDGLFETMRVRRGAIRLLDFHLQRLAEGCRRLAIAAPDSQRLYAELRRAAATRRDAVLKLIVTRGTGPRGYRPTGRERTTRVLTLHTLSRTLRQTRRLAVDVRVCTTRLGTNRALAGLKTLNRLESVMARAEWTEPEVWEGLLLDADDHIICGTMSNVFLRHGAELQTPLLDRCGVAGVMRRWILEEAHRMNVRVRETRIHPEQLVGADEVFMTNAVAGIVSVDALHRGRLRHRFLERTSALALRERLERL